MSYLSRVSRHAAILLGSTALAGFCLPATAWAQKIWTGATNDWYSAGNWSPSGVPANGDDVTIDTIAPKPAVVDGGNAVAGSVFVGRQATGALTIQNGGSVSDQIGYVGNKSGATGTATVDGSNSVWSNAGNLYVGDSGKGTLTIRNGGAVTDFYGFVGNNAGSTGDITVTGAGSSWTNQNVYVGYGGTGTLTVANGGHVTDAGGTVGAVAGSKGTVTVDGANSVWANTGTLIVGAQGTGTMTVSNGGSVTNNNGNVGFAAGSSGTVTVTGAGSSWTNAADLQIGYRGTGTLAIANGGSVSNVNGNVGSQIGAVGTVTIDGANSIWSNSGNLSVGALGTGALTVSNGGKLSVDGALNVAAQVSSVGTLNIGAAAGQASAPGIIAANAVAFGAGTGSLTFNHTSSNYVFAPTISGTGTINQLAGVTVLNADDSGFTGATNVLGGRLAVNGLLSNSAVTVAGGGALGGNGTVGNVTAQSGGIVSPGNSIGTLMVNGNYSQASGSIYQAEVGSSGQSDRINVTGSVTLANGALLQLMRTAPASAYAAGMHYTLLSANGGVNGTYTLTGDTAISNFLFFTASYDPTHVYLDVAKKSFASAAVTPNQIATASVLDSLPGSNSLFGALSLLPTETAARAAYGQLSGEVHASAKGLMIEDDRLVREAALDRLRAAFDAVGAVRSPTMAYAADGPVAVPANTDRLAVWARGFGSFGRSTNDGNAATIKRDIGGVVFGGDAAVGDTWRVGMLGGYSRSSFRVGDLNSSGTSDNYHVGLYGGSQWGALAFRSGLAYTRHDIATSRSVALPGFADHLTAAYSASTAQAFGELGYRVDLGARAAIEPFVALAYTALRTGSFTEAGGAAALTGRAANTDAGFSTLGLRSSVGFDLAGTAAAWRGMLGWRHAYGDVTPAATLAFAGSNPFTVTGVPIARNVAAIDTGLDLAVARNVTLGVGYSGQIAKRAQDYTVKADLNWKF